MTNVNLDRNYYFDDTNNSAYETDESLLFIPRENFVLEWLKQTGSKLIIASYSSGSMRIAAQNLMK